MTLTRIAKGAALAASLTAMSACGVTTTAGNPSLIADNYVGTSGCSNLSDAANALNQTGNRDVRCGPQPVSPTF